MKEAFAATAAVLAGTAVGLLLVIVFGRLLRDRRRKRLDSVRPDLELAVAIYLTNEDAQPPVAASRLSRRVLESVGVEALEELKGRERERLVELLERTGVVSEVASRLSSRRRLVRRRAAETLAQIGSSHATPALVEGLEDRDRDVRIGCAHALAEIGGHELLPRIASVLAESAAHRAGPVEEVLLVLGSQDPLALEAVDDPDSPVLHRMVTAVAGSLRLAELTPILRWNLASPDDQLVESSIAGLGKIGDLDVFDSIVEILEDRLRPERVRATAAHTLGRLGDPRAVEPLERLLHEPSWTLRQAAASALACFPERQDALEAIAT